VAALVAASFPAGDGSSVNWLCERRAGGVQLTTHLAGIDSEQEGREALLSPRKWANL
jgi:hypothetical protein